VMGLGLGSVVEDVGLCGKLAGFYCLVEVQDCVGFLFAVALIQVRDAVGIAVVRSIILLRLY
jgi:hypothetical protein